MIRMFDCISQDPARLAAPTNAASSFSTGVNPIPASAVSFLQGYVQSLPSRPLGSGSGSTANDAIVLDDD
jgi:hypothetical protein